MISYIFLIEKALKQIGTPLSSKQNQKIIKGIWNLINKFWIDTPNTD